MAVVGDAVRANPDLMANLLAEADANLVTQPCLPAAMPEGGVWVLVYDNTKLSGESTPPEQSHLAFSMSPAASPMLTLLATMGQGPQNSQDPVERFYVHQQRQG